LIPDATSSISVHEHCEDSFDLDDYIGKSIEIEYRGQRLPQKCKLRFDSDKLWSNICVESKRFFVKQLYGIVGRVRVEYHKGTTSSFPDKVSSSSLPVIVFSLLVIVVI